MSATHYGCKYKQILFTMQTIGNRIREIKNFYFGTDRGSDKKFADFLEVTKQTAANWFGRGNGIGEKVINQILTAFPDVDRGWLVGGNGPMLISEKGKVKIHIADMPKFAETANKSGFSIVEGFSEKLRLLGYDTPKDEKGYKVVAVKLVEDAISNPSLFVERITGVRPTMPSEAMVNMVASPLLDRLETKSKEIERLEKELAMYKSMDKSIKSGGVR